jgi:putative FmdB family regulatory protein
MPVYVYHCDECGFQFEQQQKFSDNPLKKCPNCSKDSLHKVYTPVGIIYKGSGFYSTDHRSSSGAVTPTKQKSESEKSEKSEKKDESGSKAETKTEPQAAPKPSEEKNTAN